MNETNISNILSNISESRFASLDDKTINIEVNNDIKQIKINSEVLNDVNNTEFLNNENNNEVITTFNNKEIRDNIKNTDKIISISSKRKKKSTVQFLTSQITQYYGTVTSIDYKSSQFTCILKDNNDDIITSKFDFEDVEFDSDKELIVPGAEFVLIIGYKQEILYSDTGPKLNGKTRFYNILFRRIRKLNKKEMMEANELQKRWSKLFN